jgi:hypothetical protein
MILFFKSLHADDDDGQMPLIDKLILIFKQRVEDAPEGQDRVRAERDLKKLRGSSGSEAESPDEGKIDGRQTD